MAGRWDRFADALYDALSRVGEAASTWWRDARVPREAEELLVILVTVSVTTLVAVPVSKATPPQTVLFMYLPAVMAGAMHGGLASGMAVTLVGGLLAELLFILPKRAEIQAPPGDPISLLLYILIACLILLITRAQERQRERVEAMAGQLESRVLERTEELQEANRELESFCYSISHDLRTPMRSIVAHSRMLVEDMGDRLDDSERKSLAAIANSAIRLARLVDDLLNHARIGHLEMSGEWIDLTALADETVMQVGAESDIGMEIRARVQPGMTVTGDRTLLGLVLRNLIENACKYAKPRDALHIEIGERRVRGKTVYFVKDNGIGFDMAYVEKIFEPFQRLHRDVDFPGTGIGLANVKRIIERHDGQVWAEAKPGEGATFFFTLQQGPRTARRAARAGARRELEES